MVAMGDRWLGSNKVRTHLLFPSPLTLFFPFVRPFRSILSFPFHSVSNIYPIPPSNSHPTERLPLFTGSSRLSLSTARQCPRQRRPLLFSDFDFHITAPRSPLSLIMKSIIFGLTLVSAAVAQIVNGVSTVEAPGPSATPPPPSDASAQGYAPPVAPPSEPTAAPSSNGDFYQQMPYESYKNGGYKSLDCGYGYQKSSDGHCQPESWVRSVV